MKKKARTGGPVWSTRTIMLTSIPVLTVITILVYALSHRSFFVETERLVLVVSLCLFAFFAHGLYSGVQIQHHSKELSTPILDGDTIRGPSPEGFLWAILSISPPDLGHIELPHFSLDGIGDGADDAVGCLISILLWIAAAILLTLLAWMLAQILAIVVPMVLLGLYWITYRALKMVFSKSAECCKQLLPSLGYSLLYTFLYTGWLVVVVRVGRFVIVGE